MDWTLMRSFLTKSTPTLMFLPSDLFGRVLRFGDARTACATMRRVCAAWCVAADKHFEVINLDRPVGPLPVSAPPSMLLVSHGDSDHIPCRLYASLTGMPNAEDLWIVQTVRNRSEMWTPVNTDVLVEYLRRNDALRSLHVHRALPARSMGTLALAPSGRAALRRLTDRMRRRVTGSDPCPSHGALEEIVRTASRRTARHPQRPVRVRMAHTDGTMPTVGRVVPQSGAQSVWSQPTVARSVIRVRKPPTRNDGGGLKRHLVLSVWYINENGNKRKKNGFVTKRNEW